MTIPTAFVWFGNFNESCGWMFCFFPAPFAWTTFCVWRLGWWTLNSTVFKNLMERKVSIHSLLKSRRWDLYRYISKIRQNFWSSQKVKNLQRYWRYLPQYHDWSVRILRTSPQYPAGLIKKLHSVRPANCFQNPRHTFTAKVFVVSAASPLHWIRCSSPMPVYIWPTTRWNMVDLKNYRGSAHCRFTKGSLNQ